jgi:hypothetical protein
MSRAGFDGAWALLETLLAGAVRREIIAGIAKSGNLRQDLVRLRAAMQSHSWTAGRDTLDLERIVTTLDRKTRREGLHAMHDWDGVADNVNPDMIAVDVLNYVADRRGDEDTDPVVLAILLDYYFMYLLALLSLRLWDDGDADANLDRLGTLLEMLQGPDGSGQQFAADSETLILIATSHFELDEHGYDLLLERTRTLNARHQVRVAIGHAPCLGSHLRFGFEATYGRDTVNMRNDNIADYPWLVFSLTTLMREYQRMREAGISGFTRDIIVEAMLNGLTPDARVFVGGVPGFLAPWAAEIGVFREGFRRYADDLLADFERFRPTAERYSPMAFFFNFSHNVLKGTVVDALLTSQPWSVTINDLATGLERGQPSTDAKERLARTLMNYARENPHKIRGRLTPVIVYDPQAGRQAFSITLRKLKE